MGPDEAPKRGRARSAVTTRAYAGVHCKEAVEFFVAVFRDAEESTKDRMAAAKIILEYGAGKPAIMDHDGEVVREDGGDEARKRLEELRARYPELRGDHVKQDA